MDLLTINIDQLLLFQSIIREKRKKEGYSITNPLNTQKVENSIFLKKCWTRPSGIFFNFFLFQVYPRGVDSWYNSLQNFSFFLLWQCCLFFDEYGGHYSKQVKFNNK